MTDDKRARNLATAKAAFEGVSNADAEAQLANYTDDMVLELAFTDPPVRLDGKQAALQFLAEAFAVYKMRLTITRVHECLDPDELIVEFTSEGHLATTGKPYANVYIVVLRFRDGQICFQREFFNSLMADRALSA